MSSTVNLKEICKLLRYDIVTATTTAGSGHPSSSLSAVELMASLFFGGYLKYDLHNLKAITNDRVIFSKGHASPLLYSLYHVAGVIKYEELLTLRSIGSNLEGHPTPRFKYVDVATGSLGQGLSVGVGMALGLRLDVLEARIDKRLTSDDTGIANIKRLPKIWVLLGDSELAEGQNWEAIEIASYYKLNNLVGILDMNRVGQRGETMAGWDESIYQKRLEAFGWNTIIIQNGHNLDEIAKAFETIEEPKSVHDDRPTMIIAKTVKGKGVSFMEDKDGWHGKAIAKEKLDEALKDIGKVDMNLRATISLPSHAELVSASQIHSNEIPKQVRNDIPKDKEKEVLIKLSSFIEQKHIKIENVSTDTRTARELSLPTYKKNDKFATRQAFGDALLAFAKTYPQLVVLDGEMANSLYTEEFGKKYPERYFEMYIAEQNMVSAAVGLDKTGYIPFATSFGSFMSRAFDQIRMAQYSESNINIIGSHVGVSIGQDGSSQMALEDISMMRSILKSIVLYPSDATSTYKLVELMLQYRRLSYLRLTREKLPVIYDPSEQFWIGGSKVLKQSPKDTAVIFTAGYTLHEALKAYEELKKHNIHVAVVDLYSIKPIDIKTVQHFAQKTKNVIVVEDHYPAGGIGEAVLSALHTNLKLIRLQSSQYQTQNSKKPSAAEYTFTHLCVRQLPHSGSPEDVLAYEQINAEAIIKIVNTHRQTEFTG